MDSWRTPERVLSSLLIHFSRQSKAALLTKAYLTLILITVIDYVTGAELSLFIFYLYPIIIISWFVGKRQGLVIALAATLATAFHDLLQADSSLVLAVQDVTHYWNFLQRGGIFLTVSYIIAALRTSETQKRSIENRLAKIVQSFLLPQTAQSVGSLTCFGLSRASDHLSGDFFDLIPLGSKKLAILVGDICGKGMSASLLMAYIQGLLRSHVPFVEEALAALMNNINHSLHRVTADDKFASLFIGIYDEENCLLTYVNAGHDPPVIFRLPAARTAGSEQEMQPDTRAAAPQTHSAATPIETVKLQNGGLLLGVDPNYEYHTASEKLRDGDVIVCDTDGMKEAINRRGQMYGADRVARIVAFHHGESAEKIHGHIFQDVETFVGGEPQADDVTLVVGTVSMRPRPS